MVHGTGSFGGGGSCGGGEFSGDVGYSFTATTIHTHNLHSSRNYGEGGDCDCSWICVCFCCRGQSFQVRICTLWTWIVAIILTTSLVTVFHVNKTQSIEATVTDMRKIPKKFSETFCDGVTVTSHKSTFNAYLMDGEPSNYLEDFQSVTFKKKTQIKYNNYEYWGFYLLANSKIKISACSDSSLEFMIVRGEKDFKKFKNDDCTYSCSVFSTTLYCFTNRPVVYHYTVKTDDEYYLIFANRYIRPYPTGLKVNFRLDRRLYDLSNNVKECSNSQTSPSCTLHSPSLHSHPSIVLNVTSSSDNEGDAEIDVACISRKWVYVVIFFLVPAVLGILGTIFIVKKYRKKETQAPTSTRSPAPFTALPDVLEESQQTSDPATRPGYGTVISPPKYEENGGAPPSYEEVKISVDFSVCVRQMAADE